MSSQIAAPTAVSEKSLPRRSDHQTPQLPAVRPWLAILLLTGWSGLLFYYGLSAGELYRTESLRAIIAAEFLRSGNWVVPTLYGEPLFTKPPGMYAMIALVSWPFGSVTEWTARLPSALAATATVFLFYWYFSRLLGRLAGLLAAAILPTCFMWLDKASAAEIDMMQVAWVTAAILFFLRALEAEEDKETGRQGDKETGRQGDKETGRQGDKEIEVLAFRITVGTREGSQWQSCGIPAAGQQGHPVSLSPCLPVSLSPCLPVSLTPWFWWLAALLCVAGGVLTKWTAPAFFYGMVIPLLWLRGRLRLLWGRQHLTSVVLAVGVCMAWIATAVAQTGWHPFWRTVSQEALMRLLPSYHHRPYPWAETLAHPLKVFAGNLPWSVVALFALRPGFARQWNERGRRFLQALHCWLWPNLLFWSVIPEHAPRHSFPMYPAVAGLATLVWFNWMTAQRPKAIRERYRFFRSPFFFRITAIRPGAVLIGVLACWLVLKVVFVHAVIPARNYHREPRAKGELIARLVPEGKMLYLFRLKDEGIMFYYGRPVRRLANVDQLPSSSEPLYCILDESEWRTWHPRRAAQVVEWLRDEQGAPIVLVKLPAVTPPSEKGLSE